MAAVALASTLSNLRLFGRTQACRYVRLKLETFRYHEREGAIPTAHTDHNGRRYYRVEDLDRFLRQHTRNKPKDAGEVAARAFACFNSGDDDVSVVIALRLVPERVRELRAQWAETRGHVLMEATVVLGIRSALDVAGYPSAPADWPEVVRHLVERDRRLAALDVSRAAPQAREHGEAARQGSGKGRGSNGAGAKANGRGSGELSRGSGSGRSVRAGDPARGRSKSRR